MTSRERNHIVAWLFAQQLGLIAFATVLATHALSGAAFEPAIKQALGALMIFYGLGLVIGDLARRVVEDAVQTDLNNWLIEQEAIAAGNPPSITQNK